MTAFVEDTLFDAAALVHPDYTPALSIAERFGLFNAANPWILRRLERLTADYLARGRTRLRINYLIEIVRDEYEGDVVDPTERWAVNHDYRSRYARLIMQRHPEWDGVFQLRELRAA